MHFSTIPKQQSPTLAPWLNLGFFDILARIARICKTIYISNHKHSKLIKQKPTKSLKTKLPNAINENMSKLFTFSMIAILVMQKIYLTKMTQGWVIFDLDNLKLMLHEKISWCIIFYALNRKGMLLATWRRFTSPLPWIFLKLWQYYGSWLKCQKSQGWLCWMPRLAQHSAKVKLLLG